jgi:putative Holliday junction resolvase
MKYLGIDWGEKRIGLAIREEETEMVIPFGVVSNIDEVIKIIKNEEIDKIVIGSPISLKNEELEMKKKIDEFVTKLKRLTSKEIFLIDERLSSKAADNLPGDKKNKASRDAIAAMLILENYLDRCKNINMKTKRK